MLCIYSKCLKDYVRGSGHLKCGFASQFLLVLVHVNTQLLRFLADMEIGVAVLVLDRIMTCRDISNQLARLCLSSGRITLACVRDYVS